MTHLDTFMSGKDLWLNGLRWTVSLTHCSKGKPPVLIFPVTNVLFDAGFDGGRLSSVFGAVPLTGTLGIVVLRRTEALALTENTAAALMSSSWTYKTPQQLNKHQPASDQQTCHQTRPYWPGCRHTRQCVPFFTATSDLSAVSAAHSENLQQKHTELWTNRENTITTFCCVIYWLLRQA